MVPLCLCLCEGLLLIQRDSAVAEGRDPPVHAGLVCRENAQNKALLIKVIKETFVHEVCPALRSLL